MKEIFEKLGYTYEISEKANQICVYNLDTNEWLWFYLDRKTIEYTDEINIDLLKLINKQCNELGWFNDN